MQATDQQQTSQPNRGSNENAPPWLVMFYLAGDNDLTEDMVLALQELKEGAPEGDKIVAQFDPSAIGLATQRYDFSDPKKPDGTRKVYLEDFLVDTEGEVNTGNADAIGNFIKWAHQQYPEYGGNPYRHLLVLSGHGSGTTEDFLLRDENATDALSIDELE
jgi:hypothetical protein